MKSAFDANVPRLKPLGQKKASAGVAAPPETQAEAPAAPPSQPAAPDAAEKLRAHMQARARKDRPVEALSRAELAHSIAASVAGVAAAEQAAPTEDTLARGRQRIARLRDRLEAAGRAGAEEGPVEPRAATEAARQLVDGFRARLRALGEERDALEGALAQARAEAQALRAQLADAGRRLEAAEATARERVELSRSLLAETEALATERDQALSRVAELKALDEQQTRLLGDAEAALAERDGCIAGLEGRLLEQAHLLEARAGEVAELTGRAARRTAERDESLARVQALEAEVHALQESRQALAEIKRMVEAAKL